MQLMTRMLQIGCQIAKPVWPFARRAARLLPQCSSHSCSVPPGLAQREPQGFYAGLTTLTIALGVYLLNPYISARAAQNWDAQCEPQHTGLLLNRSPLNYHVVGLQPTVIASRASPRPLLEQRIVDARRPSIIT